MRERARMRGATQRKVVVLTHIQIYQSAEGGLFVARDPKLGLTAYGRSAERAEARLHVMFECWARGQHKLGKLEELLGRSGLEWHWEIAGWNLQGIDESSPDRSRLLAAVS